MIFGIYFIRKFDIDIYARGDLWRRRENGENWYSFSETETNKVILHGECARIKEISAEQQELIKKLLKEVFPLQSQPLGKTYLIKHKIRISPDATPIRHKIRCMSQAILDLAIKEAKRWLELGVMEESQSSWCSAPVMVLNPNGSYRMCIDFRYVNNLTEKDTYSLPNLDGILWCTD